jgi:exodeoxyribonuclease V alpha subunit
LIAVSERGAMFDKLRTMGSAEDQALALGRYMAACLLHRAGLGEKDRLRFEQVIYKLCGGLGEGHICIEVDEKEQDLLKRIALVRTEADAPLVLSGGLLYFGRYYRYETDLASSLILLTRVGYEHPDHDRLLDTFFGDGADPHQRSAARVALTRGLCIIGGGPGTGKTTTIVNIVGLLQACYGNSLNIALAAPTGKAAMRMRASVQSQVAESRSDQSPQAAVLAAEPQTLHRLLGLHRYSPKPKFHPANPLSADVIIVDEASMVDLALMAKLVGALKKGARLVLLGDRDQLASVESGAVLADCMQALPNHVVELKTRYRFSHEISELSDAIKSGHSDRAWELLSRPDSETLSLGGRHWLEQITASYSTFLQAVRSAVRAGANREHYGPLFAQFDRLRVLCAVRSGPFGVKELNRLIELRLAGLGYETSSRQWYAGRPVMITRNDYTLELFNGDIGLCLPDPDSAEGLSVWFEGRDNRLRRYLPGQISGCETAWAMTIHKSQGSEFGQVCIVLGDSDNRVLCRELLYTAVTRAREKLNFVVDETVFRTTIARSTMRYSGLAERLRLS